MTTLHDAVGDLIRTQTMRVSYLPGDPSKHYTARAPCLLAQLAAVVASSSGGRGGRTKPGSRLPLDATALDLWVDITTSVHAWARDLGVDRRPFIGPTATPAATAERQPAWMRALGDYVQGVDWTTEPTPPPATAERAAPAPPPAAQLHAVPAADTDPMADRTLPPLGQLLRRVAAAAAGDDQAPIAATITRRAQEWANRITTLLTPDPDVRELRGIECSECNATTTTEYRQGEGLIVIPAMVMQMAVMPGADTDDPWPYLSCRACGMEGWLEYRTQDASDNPYEAADAPGVCPCCCHTGGAYRPACDIPGGCGSVGCDGRGTITRSAA